MLLGNAAGLARDLHRDIAALAARLEKAATVKEVTRVARGKDRSPDENVVEIQLIIAEIKLLLDSIDRNTPLILLAITASGESLSTSVPQSISPSRLLQASTFLTFGDTQFAHDPGRPVQIGPSFTLSLYMLFLGHASGASPSTPGQQNRGPTANQEAYGFGEGERRPIWQEVLHKARVRLCRTPLDWEFNQAAGYCPRGAGDVIDGRSSGHSIRTSGRPDEFAYSVEIIEDLDDGRVHDEEDEALPGFDDIPHAGVRVSMPVYQISKIFYADTGRILNIGNAKEFENRPVLLLKRDAAAAAPSKVLEHMMSNQDEDHAVSDDDSSPSSDEQTDIDRQLREESAVEDEEDEKETGSPGSERQPRRWDLPQHLDPEWIALEVFMEDDEDSEPEDDEDITEELCMSEGDDRAPVKRTATPRSSLDSKLITQIRNVSLRSSPGPGSQDALRRLPRDTSGGPMDSPETFVARSPFGTITSSLSLMEMLIRLTSLQEFQQASHLSIPDHILSFFLEETSTTGLRGEERWKARNEAKRRVGFDPYTDTPSK